MIYQKFCINSKILKDRKLIPYYKQVSIYIQEITITFAFSCLVNEKLKNILFTLSEHQVKS